MKTNKEPFKSSLSFKEHEVSKILRERILQENLMIKKNTTDLNLKLDNEILKNVKTKKKCINISSLFSGAGGLDLGVIMAQASVKYGEKQAYDALNDEDEFKSLIGGINIIYSNDIFKSANETFSYNFGSDVVKDTRDIRQILKFPQSDLMLGGFPCPGFSAAGPRLLDDPRNFLYIHYIRALMQSNPLFFIAENVKGLMTMANGQVLKQIKEDFSSVGYQVSVHLVNSRDYGVPQIRERVFLIGVRNDVYEKYGFTYQLPTPTHGINKKPYATLRDAIGDLPQDTNDVFESNYSSMYMSRNRKKGWDDQSFTIQASGRQAPQHPGGQPMKKIEKDSWEFQGEFNRRLSVSEVARIQTFPDWFKFSDGNKLNVSKNNRLNEQYKQIGNAVPVILAEKISRPIIDFLNSNSDLLM